tara:strand:- start:21 stop:476 length:456 start_codon:yes stop_codon:yes gene_type:complete
MALPTGSNADFFGTQDTLGTSSAAVSDAAFSIATDLSTWTNDDDAQVASVTLLANFAVAPDANSAVNLFYRLLNVEGIYDNPIPDSNFQHTFAKVIPLNDATGDQYVTVIVSLENGYSSQQYEFYIQNESGQTISAGWNLYVTPKAVGSRA